MADRHLSRMRVTLIAAFVLVLLVMITLITLFTINAHRHVGADYLAFASDIVRVQQDGVQLRLAIESLEENPEPLHQQQLQRALSVIASRLESTRHAIRNVQLAPVDYRHVHREFDNLDALLPRLEALASGSLEDEESIEELKWLALEFDDSLAYAYSELHELVHAAAAQQRQLMGWLNWTLILLGALLLLFIAGLLLAMDKIFGQKRALERLSATDEVTGLNNRRALLDTAGRALALARRSHQPVSLALIDFDHFKRINDEHGHPNGDRVLKQFADTLQEMIRQTDTVARIGGEEFCLLMPNTERNGAMELCERIRSTIATLPLEAIDGQPALTVSIGIATTHGDSDASFNTLYSQADHALYEAKVKGRNKTITYKRQLQAI
ncbi:hypothetical protein GCM10007160_17280 [Litchfieldella qijiaojingensis]|uniref:diguanylate cyclase n=1 Tax=Litchfieldella qijiaojingensis TaxID=980347 RepID=A0ABQ2YQY9_9GAMM|nr:GGDEF domain-containing protein [Halomonas qijiaojingensis]GGX90365.1 hypothetical protein GCM10007160_17280 [Halomonas qijiaojingensis]